MWAATDTSWNISGARVMAVVLGLTDETGRLLWVSAVLLGKTADITAARALCITG